MDAFQVDTAAWAREQFGAADLGDRRRTRRLALVAARMAADPSASIPGQMEGWAEAKAAYRLLDADGVTFEAIAAPHWQRTRARGPGRFLVLGDTTELDFGIRRRVPDLAPTGNGGGYGFHLHAALVVGAEDERIVGLAGERIHYRKPAPAGENTNQRLKRDRESDVWGEVIDQVGPPDAATQWVHVLDRGADNFDVYCHCRSQRSDWVVRASMLHRKVSGPGGKPRPSGISPRPRPRRADTPCGYVPGPIGRRGRRGCWFASPR